MRFRKKPVVIEAFCLGRDYWPDWFADAVTAKTVTTSNHDKRWRGGPDYADIVTLEGTMRAVAGDWIIRGVKGELYPCRADIFEATYEPEGAAVPAAPPLVREFSPALRRLAERAIKAGRAMPSEEALAYIAQDIVAFGTEWDARAAPLAGEAEEPNVDCSNPGHDHWQPADAVACKLATFEEPKGGDAAGAQHGLPMRNVPVSNASALRPSGVADPGAVVSCKPEPAPEPTLIEHQFIAGVFMSDLCSVSTLGVGMCAKPRSAHRVAQ